jgi:aryl-alcohol dehydrogenase-like predicted oxidoreductase
MRYVDVAGVRASAIGLGTWQFGSREWGYGDDYAVRVAPAIVRRALELGVTVIDTAEAYAFGRSERIVGEALRGRRDGAFVATKFLPVVPLSSVVERQARGSLRRLDIEAIDLYQIHWPNPFAPPRATRSGLRHLLDQGLVRNIGVSNYSLDQWRSAERALGRPVVSNQVRFSLADPRPRWSLVPYARERDRIVIAYSPLGQGFLAGRVDAPRPARGIRRLSRLFRASTIRRASPLLWAISEIADAHEATPSQVALAWLIGHGNVIAIPGAHTVEQLEENAAAADLELTADEHARLAARAERFEAGSR